MKNKTILLMLFAFILISKVNAQTNNEEAILTYQLAQEEYDKANYTNALKYLDKVEKLNEQASADIKALSKVRTSYLKAKCYEKQLFYFDNVPEFREMLNNYNATESILNSIYSRKGNANNYGIDYSAYIKCLENAIFYINNGKDDDKKTELLRLKIKIENSDEYNLIQTTELYNKALIERKKSNYESALKLLNEAKSTCKIMTLFFNPLLPATVGKENNIYTNFDLDTYLLNCKLHRYDCDEIKAANNISELAKKLNLQIPFNNFSENNVDFWNFDVTKAMITHDYKPIATQFTSKPYETNDRYSYNLKYVYLAGDYNYIKDYGQKALYSKHSQKNKDNRYCDKYICFTDYEFYNITIELGRVYLKEGNTNFAKNCALRFLDLSKELNFKVDSVWLMYLYTLYDHNKAEQYLNEYIHNGQVTNYNSACVASLLKKKEMAFEYLEKLLLEMSKSKEEEGYYWFYYCQFDPDLEYIKGQPEFLALLKKYYPEKF